MLTLLVDELKDMGRRVKAMRKDLANLSSNQLCYSFMQTGTKKTTTNQVSVFTRLVGFFFVLTLRGSSFDVLFIAQIWRSGWTPSLYPILRRPLLVPRRA